MYLLYGESFRLMEEEMEKIIKENPNRITIDLNTSTIKDVIAEATFVSMFQEQKYIVVRNADFFTSAKSKEEDIELLLKYMENPVSLSTIIFTTYHKVDARKKIYKEFSKKYKVKMVDITDKIELMNKIRDKVFQHKFKIESETIEYIENACQNKYDLIYNELEKIFLYYKEPQKIELSDVKQIVSRTLQDNNFKFVDAVIQKNMSVALTILEDLYTLKVDPIVLLNLLSREFHMMLSVTFLQRQGFPFANILSKLGLQDWQGKKYSKNASLYYEEDLKTYIKELGKIDYRIKSGLGNRFLELKNFLLFVWS